MCRVPSSHQRYVTGSDPEMWLGGIVAMLIAAQQALGHLRVDCLHPARYAML